MRSVASLKESHDVGKCEQPATLIQRIIRTPLKSSLLGHPVCPATGT